MKRHVSILKKSDHLQNQTAKVQVSSAGGGGRSDVRPFLGGTKYYLLHCTVHRPELRILVPKNQQKSGTV